MPQVNEQNNVTKWRQQQQHPSAKLWSRHSVRLQMALLLMLAFLVFSLMRGNLGMALMCMVARNRSGTAGLASSKADHNTDLQVHWSPSDISLMHMSIYVGVFVCTFLTQSWAQRYGPKTIISMGLVVNVLCTWAVPLAVYWMPHFSSVSVLRFLVGLSQGFFIPCASLLIAKWFPEAEKSTAMAIFTTGNQLGIAIAMFTTAELCKVPFLAGWPTSFFLYGLSGMVLLAVWHWLATDKPHQSKRITAVELAHIDNVRVGSSATLIMQTPYRQMLISPVVLAICMCSFAQSFVFVAMISYLPEFYHSVLGLNLTSNGVWSAMPFLVQMVSKILLTLAASSAQSRFSAQFITKFSNSLASFGCALCMLIVSLNPAPALMLAFLCAAFAFLSGYVPGYNTSIVCVAPPFTAAISAYGQAYAQLASILAPIIIGQLTGESNKRAWSLVFQLLVAILVISGLVFQFFGSVEVQVWAQTDVVSCGGSVSSRQMARFQCISEANDQLKREEEEAEGRMQAGGKRHNKKGKKGTTVVEISLLVEENGGKKKNGAGVNAIDNTKRHRMASNSSSGGTGGVDFPRMHHRLSTLAA